MLSSLTAEPQVVIDDAKFRDFDALPLFRRIGAGDALSRFWILRVGAAIPFDGAAIESVVQDSGAAIELARDRRVRPQAPARSSHPFAIQVSRDRLGTLPGGKLPEDPPNDACLVGIDQPRAAPVAVPNGSLVAIGDSGRDASLQDTPELAALRLFAEVLQRHLRHHAHDRDMDVRDLAERGRVEADPLECELILKVGRIGQTTAKPVDRLADDDVESMLGGVGDQLLEARPEAAGAADRRVFVSPDNRPALRFGITPADLDLVLERGLALQIGRVAGVDDGAHAISFSDFRWP
jgi:hypothetical protein